MIGYFLSHLQVLFLPLLLSVALVISKKEHHNDICKEKDLPGFKLKLTGALIFPEYILLIDGKHQAYEVPRSNYEGSYGRMTLNIKGVPIEKYWPPMATNTDWTQCIKKKYLTIYHLIFEKTKHVQIYFDIRIEDCDTCLCYNLNTHKFCPDRSPLETSSIIQYLIDTGDKIYSIAHRRFQDNLYPTMSIWKFSVKEEDKDPEGVGSAVCLMFYLVDSNNNRNVSIYDQNDFSSDFDPPPPGHRRENITDWNISEDYLPVGYLFNGSFYLYALDKLIIFEDRMPSYENLTKNQGSGRLLASSRMTVIKMSDYFHCDSQAESNVTYPPEVPANQSGSSTAITFSSTSNTMLTVIIAAVAALCLILIAAAIIIYCCLCGKKKKNEKKSKDGKSGKGKKKKKKGEKPSKSSFGGSQASKLGAGGSSKMTSASKVTAGTSGSKVQSQLKAKK